MNQIRLLLLFGIAVFSCHHATAQGIWHDGQNATSVLGQANFDDRLQNRGGFVGPETLNYPKGIVHDPDTGKVFVADSLNHRVLRFSSAEALENSGPPEAVLGQADFVSDTELTSASRMNEPIGLALGPDGELWVADSENARVLRFDSAATKPTGANADGVLGQSTFGTSATVLSQSGMFSPVGVAVDSSGTLWVSDPGHARVLRFDSAASKINGADADGVLGAPDFTTLGGGMTANNNFNMPQGLATDSAGRLWVADFGNHRVLRFENAATKNPGDPADGVLGQASFTTASPALSPTGLRNPAAMAIDSAGTLWIVDSGNSRIVRFENAAVQGDGSAADGVIGQADLNAGGSGPGQARFSGPLDLALAGRNRLWIADTINSRVVRHEADRSAEIAAARARASLNRQIRNLRRAIANKKRLIRTARRSGNLRRVRQLSRQVRVLNRRIAIRRRSLATL